MGNTVTDGSNWSFNDATGTISILGSNGRGCYDFTGSGFSSVTSGTAVTFGFLGPAGGGEELTSFTISPTPEPSAALLGLIGALLLCRRR